MEQRPTIQKVFVMMSGGVDSSVAALLLSRDPAYDVTGVFIRGYNVDGCQEREAEDARRVAGHIGIPFYVVDLEAEYKRHVVAYMVEGYRNGITPNPDVMCNKEIKFGAFLEKAIAMGADLVATGHYVGKRQEAIWDAQTGTMSYALAQAKDKNKDQSYFLWTLTQEQLRRCLFPIGDFHKSEIRVIAAEAGLPTAEKKDSQGICFLGKITIREFLEQYLPKRTGDIVTIDGMKVGEHDGAWFYTIGQRHGLRIGGGPAYYVVAKDVAQNRVIVAHADRAQTATTTVVDLVEVNVMGRHTLDMPDRIPVSVRVRYRQPLFEATLVRRPMNAPTAYRLEFSKPQPFVTAGQSAVWYDAEGVVIGGGILV